MAVQTHKCNQPGCDGFVLYDDADFNYKKTLAKDTYVLDTPTCNKCEKEFKVVVSHILIEVDEDDQMVDSLPSSCYSEYEEARKKEKEETY